MVGEKMFVRFSLAWMFAGIFFGLIWPQTSYAEEDIYNRSFNRENFHLQTYSDATRPEGPFGEILSHPVNILRQIRNNQNSRNRALLEMQQRTPTMNASDYQMRYAALEFDTDYKNRTSGSEIAAHLEREATKVIGSMIIEQLDFYKRFNEGLSFNLDLTGLFSRGKPSEASPESRPKDNIRYGLVLNGVEYSDAPIAIAALTNMENALPFATQSRPVWGIEELNTRPKRRPFNVRVPAPKSYLEHQVLTDDEVELDAHDETYLDHHLPVNERSLWSRTTFPSLEFDGRVRPRRGTDINELAEGSAGMPGMQLQLNQAQGYYSLSYLTDSKFKKDRITHQVAVPIHGTLALKRIYDENFKEQETIAENILVRKDLPALTVRKLHTNDSFRAGLRHSTNGHSFTISAETPSGWQTSSGLFKNEGEKYRADYRFRF